MRSLWDVRLETGALPQAWTLTPEAPPKVTLDNDGLHCGRDTGLRITLPGNGWKHVRVTAIVAFADQPGAIECGDSRSQLFVNARTGWHAVRIRRTASVADHKHRIEGAGPHAFTFDLTESTVTAHLGDTQLVTGPNLDGEAHDAVDLVFWHNCIVQRIAVEVEDELPAPRYHVRPRDTLDLEICVDFPDDLYYAPYTEEMFAKLFAMYRDWGVKRCQWLYYGGKESGFWTSGSPIGIHNGYNATVENVGDIFTAAVKHAHDNGIEIFGLFKPFDTGIGMVTLPPNHPDAAEQGKLDRIGAAVTCIADFPAKRRDLIMQCKPGVAGPGNPEPITRIELVKEDDDKADFTVDDVRLFVSDDNHTYRPYDGDLTRSETVEDVAVWEHTPSGGRPTDETRSSRVMRFDDLHITEPFVALTVDSKTLSFANTLVNLLHVYGESGEHRCLTYGIKSRMVDRWYDIVSTPLNDTGHGGVDRMGVEFDVFPGSPSAVLPGFDAIAQRHYLERGDGLLAFARGKALTLTSAMSPGYDDACDYWLGWARHILDAGADGIELRVRNHHSPLAWGEFGFEPPVRDAYLQRYGVDIWKTDDFDREAWRRLRGEQYTDLYRRMRKLAQARGKQMGLHVSPTLDLDPAIGGAMNMHFDWKRWIEDGLADYVTMKEVWPNSRQGLELLTMTQPRGVRAVFSPFANKIWKNGEDPGVAIVKQNIQLAREGGCDSFQFYENCAIVRAHQDGTLEALYPKLTDLFKQEFAGSK